MYHNKVNIISLLFVHSVPRAHTKFILNVLNITILDALHHWKLNLFTKTLSTSSIQYCGKEKKNWGIERHKGSLKYVPYVN